MILLAFRLHRPAAFAAPAPWSVLAGIRHTVGTAPRRKKAATADRVRAMLDACPDTMLGRRDRPLQSELK
jgi:hypothetical protein